MKTKIYLLIGCLFCLMSCKKEFITPGNYQASQTPIADTSHWQNQYSNGGVLPNWGNGSDNELVGTIWVLTNIQTSFSSVLPIDTIRFVSNTNYTINSGSIRPYTLTTGVTLSSKTLTLNYHYPFGSGNYAGEVASTFVSDGVIINCQFTNTNSTTTNIRAWFNKL